MQIRKLRLRGLETRHQACTDKVLWWETHSQPHTFSWEPTGPRIKLRSFQRSCYFPALLGLKPYPSGIGRLGVGGGRFFWLPVLIPKQGPQGRIWSPAWLSALRVREGLRK